MCLAVNGLRMRTGKSESLRSSMTGIETLTDEQLITVSDAREFTGNFCTFALVEDIEYTHFNGGVNSSFQMGLVVSESVSILYYILFLVCVDGTHL